MKCRHCGYKVSNKVVDLGFSPPSNSYLSSEELKQHEKYFPLRVSVCEKCWLVQTEDYTKAEDLFDDKYAYFSSTSKSWLKHAKDFVYKKAIPLGLKKDSLVIEIASNDGYLLKNFLDIGIPCLGIEPTISTASHAKKIGVPVLQEFFGQKLAKRLICEGKKADLIIGNNVYAHVPDLNDFTFALKEILRTKGTITLEFPHLSEILLNFQFDTIYHEHFSYFSLITVQKLFNSAGLRIFDVEKLSTHGGSLRVYGCHIDDERITKESVNKIILEEESFGITKIKTYQSFQLKADSIKNDLLLFLINQKKLGNRVLAYGAAAKGNTILNYAGIKSDLLEFVCDAAESKQGKFMPGSHIPIVDPSCLKHEKFDYLLILPWNLSDEIMGSLDVLKNKGIKFVTAIPELRII